MIYAVPNHDLWLGRAVRLGLTLDLLCWAGVLARPGETFALSHSYDLMAAWAAEDHWALAFGVAAVVCLWGFRGQPAQRLLSLLPAVAMEGAVTVSFGGGPTVGTGFGTHLVLMLLGLVLCPWEWWRA